ASRPGSTKSSARRKTRPCSRALRTRSRSSARASRRRGFASEEGTAKTPRRRRQDHWAGIILHSPKILGAFFGVFVSWRFEKCLLAAPFFSWRFENNARARPLPVVRRLAARVVGEAACDP